MRITHEKLEISPSETIYWEDVKTMRLINNKLAFILEDGKEIELKDIRSSTIDLVFRTYETYIKEHPRKRVS